MALSCPKCAAVIPTEDINVSTDVAMCRGCGTMHKAADLVHDDVADATHVRAAEVLRGPQPPGVTWSDDGQTLVLKAPCGSRTIALFLGVFAAFWTLPSLFLVGEVISGLGTGPRIERVLPDGASELEKRQHEMETAMRGTVDFADLIMAVVMTALPLMFWLGAATAMFARVTVRVRPDLGTVVKGSFPFFSRRHFDPSRVTAVVEVEDTSTRINGRHPTKIVIKADEEIGFGGFMAEARRKWVAAILAANLVRRR